MNASATFQFDDWPDEGVAFALSGLEITVDPGENPLKIKNSAAIEANWEREKAENPHLFNGSLLNLHAATLEAGRIAARAYVIPYAYHLWWRRQTPRPASLHTFAMAMMISGEGDVIAIRMSQTTANPGKVYCASGSLEPEDIIDGKVDIEANMRREVGEETGLDLADFEAGDTLYCARDNACLMFYRFFRSPLSTEAIIAKIHAHMQVDEEKEIDGVIAINRDNRFSFNYAHSMPPALALYFDQKTTGLAD
ncbi:NUDIX hydrolase [Martelella alba]|uniref:NUDIX hydrolase n=1 Tax=Martelella alba TaxID=2590451 RepID=A0A506UIJ4_9HYPH|nr:NUDIX hydrolase [Martelella alba]TPW33145.1 NUDIX hydrolase [Martelella alba]